MSTSVFIDGSAGTTGLRIRERLAARPDVTLITLPEALRKDPHARADALSQAQVAILCLPDAAAKESVALAQNSQTVLIDTSTAHRTAPGWTYGFPELHGQRAAIAAGTQIANPGCHASGFIALVAPLVSEGLVPASAALSCFSLTGYSGGGKSMIAQYEAAAEAGDPLLDAPRAYGLSGAHKHLPEMTAICGLSSAPTFVPVVANYYAGMEVTVMLGEAGAQLSPAAVNDLYADYYAGEKLIRVAPDADESGFLSAAALAGRDSMEIAAYGQAGRMTLVARFDNLGKGASGAAIQNLNIVIGADESEGLVL